MIDNLVLYSTTLEFALFKALSYGHSIFLDHIQVCSNRVIIECLEMHLKIALVTGAND